MSFNDFVNNYGLKNKTTSNIELQQILSSLSLRDVKINLGDEPFSCDVRLLNLHPTKARHWVAIINQNYIDSYGCSPPQNLPKFIIERNGNCF